jgi:hypothetical protein
MNIFFLDRDPVAAAPMHTDKHVVKMVLETAQILSTVQHRYAPAGTVPWCYKPSHENHPSVRWAGDSVAHYRWTVQLGLALTAEYTYRYGRRHACTDLLEKLAVNFPLGMPDAGWVDPPQCMPDEYKDTDAVSAYRRYYLGAKVASATWKHRPIPSLGESIMAKQPKAAPAAPVFAENAAEVATKRSRTSPNFPPEAVVEFLVENNPKRVGSKSFDRFSAYMGTGTVGEYIAAGGTYGDLKYDAEHGFIAVEGFAAVVKERKERAPKAEKAAPAPKAEKAAPIKRKAKAAPVAVEAEEESEE